MYERHDRVRLLRKKDGVPAGTEGIITGPFKREGSLYLVQFAGWGMKEIPDDSLERISGDEQRRRG